ncbi:MAG: sensor domain-containing diguanylate cyclase [Candidatus Omnitrophica bacterium]|nr:sensor domain-containing diguanylate cyclase [Candidatus Omnitrophota bacterium]
MDEKIINNENEEIQKLKEELENTKKKLHIFYELTKVLRTTLRLDEIVYIILTALTSHQGLMFNRAILFMVDEEGKNLKGFMGIGPVDMQEADIIWSSIRNQKMDLYDLIKNYHLIKQAPNKPKFMELVQSLTFPLTQESGFIFEAFWEKGILHIKKDKTEQLKNDLLIERFQLEEFLSASIWIQNQPQGLVIVDNYVTKRPIQQEDVKFFGMFMEQATGAIENSQIYEDTLIKAHKDALTNLWNHGYFQYKLDEELLNAKSKNYPLSILMIDIDDFKKFNDTYGHMQGDEALKKIGEFLNENVGEKNILCRYGGEEFAVILSSTPKEDATKLAENLREKLSESSILFNKFTISIGVASYPTDATTKEELLNKADIALYKAKKEGKNRVIFAF